VHKDILLSNVMAEKARLRPKKHGQKYAPIRLKWKLKYVVLL
jgi:hypothetical protein